MSSLTGSNQNNTQSNGILGNFLGNNTNNTQSNGILGNVLGNNTQNNATTTNTDVLTNAIKLGVENKDTIVNLFKKN